MLQKMTQSRKLRVLQTTYFFFPWSLEEDDLVTKYLMIDFCMITIGNSLFNCKQTVWARSSAHCKSIRSVINKELQSKPSILSDVRYISLCFAHGFEQTLPSNWRGESSCQLSDNRTLCNPIRLKIICSTGKTWTTLQFCFIKRTIYHDAISTNNSQVTTHQQWTTWPIVSYMILAEFCQHYPEIILFRTKHGP